MGKGEVNACCAGCARFILIGFNVLFWLSGCGILGVGVWMLYHDTVVSYINVIAVLEDSGDFIKYAAYVMIGVGAFVFVVGFCGCCGAIKENSCLIGTYIFLLVIVLGVEVAAGVFGFIFKDTLNTTSDNAFAKSVNEHYGKTTAVGKAFTQGVNFIQVKGFCCGWGNFTDFSSLDASKTPVPPVSCCWLKNPCEQSTVDLKKDHAFDYAACLNEFNGVTTKKRFLHGKTCKESLKDWLKNNSVMVMGIGLGIAGLEIIGLICASLMCCSIRQGGSKDDD